MTGSNMASLFVAAVLCACMVTCNAIFYRQVKEPHSILVYNDARLFLTIPNAAGTEVMGIYDVVNGGCALSSYKGVQKYVSMFCNPDTAGKITIKTYDPTTSPNCIGLSEQHGGTPITIVDNSRLVDIYGESTDIRATCSLTIDMSRDDLSQYQMVERFFTGQCGVGGSSDASCDNEYSLVAVSFFKTTTAHAYAGLTNVTRTVAYPCTTATAAYCNSSLCVQTSDPDIYGRAIGLTGPKINLDQYIRVSANVLGYREPSLTNWPEEKNSQACYGAWIIGLVIVGIWHVTEKIKSHPSMTDHWGSKKK